MTGKPLKVCQLCAAAIECSQDIRLAIWKKYKRILKVCPAGMVI